MSGGYRITVAPVAGGWSVRCDGGLQPLHFLSGARAEQQARALAERLSLSGRDAQVLVHDRTLALVGAARYHAAAQRDAPPI
ncbi:hypothetical protein [Phenylobacterium deserti]|uniref:DUF2188 domain-containing protein n=1 Tax=Phenylobacterium deserti TaxID=1914756 RepID=A0A328AA47_9CAUL|nr:hypothetical protein [Phenylobacterium deserti]RAK51277.1 hypothetical protein DJ018_15120 [Phenylobacterium deserti]